MGLPLSTDFSKIAPGSSKRQPALSTGAGENSDPFERIPGFKPQTSLSLTSNMTTSKTNKLSEPVSLS